MRLNRRAFLGLSAAAAATLGARVQGAGGAAAAQPTLASIHDYLEQHRAAWGIPGMTLSVVGPDGFEAVLTAGLADLESQTAVTPDHVFQIGSISKMFAALTLWSQIDEGKLSPDDRLVDLMPEITVTGGDTITVRHLLNHTAGLPRDASPFVDGGLWTGFTPGSEFQYCNLGYRLAGRIIARVDGTSFREATERRVLRPLEMNDSFGALQSAERDRYASGYEFSRMDRPNAVPAPVARAPWVEYQGAAGCIGSTPADMARFMRFLGGLAQGQGGKVLSDETAVAFMADPVAAPSWGEGVTYGNGIARGTFGNNDFLFHTGGMVQFTSAIYVDVTTGIGAFASANLHYGSTHRPRNVARRAIDLVRASITGEAAPEAPPFTAPLGDAESLVGIYTAADGSRIEIRPASDTLQLSHAGRTSALKLIGGTGFASTDPAFVDCGLEFVVEDGAVTRVWAGSTEYLADPTVGYLQHAPDMRAAEGMYLSNSRSAIPLRVYARGDHLAIRSTNYGGSLHRLENGAWRRGETGPSAERISVGAVVDGKIQRMVFSGEEFIRWIA